MDKANKQTSIMTARQSERQSSSKAGVCVVFDWLRSSVVCVRAFNQVTESPDLSAPTLPPPSGGLRQG